MNTDKGSIYSRSINVLEEMNEKLNLYRREVHKENITTISTAINHSCSVLGVNKAYTKECREI